MIQLTNTLAIMADDRQYIVGKPRERTVNGGTAFILDKPTYHTTIDRALSAALSRALREGVAGDRITTLRQYMNEQVRLMHAFECMIAPLR